MKIFRHHILQFVFFIHFMKKICEKKVEQMNTLLKYANIFSFFLRDSVKFNIKFNLGIFFSWCVFIVFVHEGENALNFQNEFLRKPWFFLFMGYFVVFWDLLISKVDFPKGAIIFLVDWKSLWTVIFPHQRANNINEFNSISEHLTKTK